MYKNVPELASEYFSDYRNSGDELNLTKEELLSSEELLIAKEAKFQEDMKDLNAAIAIAPLQ